MDGRLYKETQGYILVLLTGNPELGIYFIEYIIIVFGTAPNVLSHSHIFMYIYIKVCIYGYIYRKATKFHL